MTTYPARLPEWGTVATFTPSIRDMLGEATCYDHARAQHRAFLARHGYRPLGDVIASWEYDTLHDLWGLHVRSESTVSWKARP